MKKNFLNEDGEGSKFRIELPDGMKDYEPSAQTKSNNEPCEIVTLRGKEFPICRQPFGNYDTRNWRADQVVYSAPPVVQPASTPASTPAPPASKNITPYIYAGIGLIVILVVAKMVMKK